MVGPGGFEDQNTFNRRPLVIRNCFFLEMVIRPLAIGNLVMFIYVGNGKPMENLEHRNSCDSKQGSCHWTVPIWRYQTMGNLARQLFDLPVLKLSTEFRCVLLPIKIGKKRLILCMQPIFISVSSVSNGICELVPCRASWMPLGRPLPGSLHILSDFCRVQGQKNAAPTERSGQLDQNPREHFFWWLWQPKRDQPHFRP